MNEIAHRAGCTSRSRSAPRSAAASAAAPPRRTSTCRDCCSDCPPGRCTSPRRTRLRSRPAVVDRRRARAGTGEVARGLRERDRERAAVPAVAVRRAARHRRRRGTRRVVCERERAAARVPGPVGAAARDGAGGGVRSPVVPARAEVETGYGVGGREADRDRPVVPAVRVRARAPGSGRDRRQRLVDPDRDAQAAVRRPAAAMQCARRPFCRRPAGAGSQPVVDVMSLGFGSIHWIVTLLRDQPFVARRSGEREADRRVRVTGTPARRRRTTGRRERRADRDELAQPQ